MISSYARGAILWFKNALLHVWSLKEIFRNQFEKSTYRAGNSEDTKFVDLFYAYRSEMCLFGDLMEFDSRESMRVRSLTGNEQSLA